MKAGTQSKKILLRGHFGYRNTGDDLLLIEALERCPSEYALYVFGDEDKLESFQRYRNFTCVNGKWKMLSERFSVTLFFGGGMFPDKRFRFRQYVSLKLSLATSKLVVMHGLGIVPKLGRLDNFLFRRVLKSVDYISVRDEVSLAYLKRLGVGRGIRNCGDLFWGASPRAAREYSFLSGKHFLVCLGEPFTVAELGQEHFALRQEVFIQVMRDAIVYLSDKGYEAVLVPFSAPGDSKLIDEIVADPRIRNTKVFNPGRDFVLSQIDEIFQNADLGLCMRYHSIILAMRNGLPFVGICYDFKSSSLLEEAELTDLALKYGIRASQFFGEEVDITLLDIKERIDYLLSNQEVIKEKISAFADGRRISVLEEHARMFEFLCTYKAKGI